MPLHVNPLHTIGEELRKCTESTQKVPEIDRKWKSTETSGETPQKNFVFPQGYNFEQLIKLIILSDARLFPLERE